MTENREIEYACQLLQMNPLEQSEEILASRKEFLHPQSGSDNIINNHCNVTERKDQAMKNIKALRKCLWSLDEPRLRQQIESMNVSEFPDLAATLTRLKAIADRRESFHRLEKHPHCFPQFFDQFCNLVVAPPRKAGELRATYFQASRRETNDPHHPGPKKYRLIANVVRREFPELYILDKSWLNQLLVKPQRIKLFSLVVVILNGVVTWSLAVFLLLLVIFSIVGLRHLIK